MVPNFKIIRNLFLEPSMDAISAVDRVTDILRVSIIDV